MQLFGDLIRAPGVPPHGLYLLGYPTLLWLHAVSDFLIGISYYAILAALAYFVRKRSDIPFGGMFRMAAAVILLCGTTHLFAVGVQWNPGYELWGLAKTAAALVSALLAVSLWRLMPRALALPSPIQLQRANEELSRQIEEREKADTALQKSDLLYRLLVEGIRDYAIYMLDRDGFVTNWNRGAERIKGYTADEIIGQHFSIFYTKEDQKAGLPARALETAAREGKYEAEAWRVRKDGSRFWAALVLEPIRNDTGRLIGFAKITRDITERLQQEQALDQARQVMAQSQKMEAVGQLTGGAAHDFNNLLTVILGNLDLVRARLGDEAEAGRLLAAAGRAAERGVSLTQKLLAFSRRQVLEPRVTDCNKLVSGMSELLRRTLSASITIETVLAAGLWQAYIDDSQLESAILNLALNARDAMPNGGKLTIETGNTYLDEDYAGAHSEVGAGQYVMVAVSDTGTGMSEEVRGRAFEPFFTTKEVNKGTGLGLSQVFGFVKQSGGHIKIYSEAGQGTTIKVYLPRHLGERAPKPAPSRPNVGYLARGEAVLLVEDDDDVRAYAFQALTGLGYRVLEAADGPAALDVLDGHPDMDIDLLFTDVILPGMNGRRLADEARRRRPGIKVLFTSGYTRNAIVHHGQLDPGVALLQKPFNIESLGRKLRQVMGDGT